MTPVIIQEKNRAPFQNLISRRGWHMLDDPGTLALGAVDEEGLATGALVCRLDGIETAELLGLFVAENRRRQGDGDGLLHAPRRALRETGYRRVYCLMPDSAGTDELLSFFLARGCAFSAVAEDLTTVPLQALVEKLERAGAKQGRCLPLREIPTGYIHTALRRVREGKNREAPRFLDPEDGLDAFHPCSCGVVEGGKLTGLMLFFPRERGDGVALALAQAARPLLAAQMLYYGAKEAAKACPPGAQITFATLNGLGGRMGRLVGDLAQAAPFTCASLAL